MSGGGDTQLLKKCLLNLSNEIVDKVSIIDENVDANFITAQSLYENFQLSSYLYFPEKSNGNYSYSLFSTHSNFYTKKELHFNDIIKFKNTFRNIFKNYAECVNEVAKLNMITNLDKKIDGYSPEGFAVNEVDDFILKSYNIIFEKMYNGNDIDKKLLESLIDNFLNDLSEEMKEYRVKVYIGGIRLNDERYELNNGFYILRRPNKSDFEESRLANVKAKNANYREFDTIMNTSAVLEYKVKNAVINIQEGINANIELFRFYRQSQTSFYKYTITPIKSLKYEPILILNNTQSDELTYLFKSDDIKKYDVFAQNMYRIFYMLDLIPPFDNGNSQELLYLNLSFEMYKEALLKYININVKIAFLITSLESLFHIKDEPSKTVINWYNGKDRKMSKSEIVRDRLFSLLDLLNLNDIYLKDNIIKAYEIRDNVYHGFDISNDLQKSSISLYKPLLNYCRISLVLFLKMQLRKKDVIEKIDRLQNDITDINARSDLELVIGRDLIDILYNN